MKNRMYRVNDARNAKALKSGRFYIALFENDREIREIGYQKTLEAAKSVANQYIQPYMQKNDEYAVYVFDKENCEKYEYGWKYGEMDTENSKPVYGVGNYDTDKRQAGHSAERYENDNYDEMDNICEILNEQIEERERDIMSSGNLGGLMSDEVYQILDDELGDGWNAEQVDYSKKPGYNAIKYVIAYSTTFEGNVGYGVFGILLKYRVTQHGENLLTSKVVRISDYLPEDEDFDDDDE